MATPIFPFVRGLTDWPLLPSTPSPRSRLLGFTLAISALGLPNIAASAVPIAPLDPVVGCGIITNSTASNYATKPYWSTFRTNHPGVDLALSPLGTATTSACSLGKPVKAICPGTVVSFNASTVADQAVITIDHPDCNGRAVRAYYGHLTLAEPVKRIGKSIAAGETLGTIMAYPGAQHRLHLTLDTRGSGRNLSALRYELCGFTATAARDITALRNCVASSVTATPGANQVLLRIGWGAVATAKTRFGTGAVLTGSYYINRTAMNALGFIGYFGLLTPPPPPPAGAYLNDTGIVRCADGSSNTLFCPVTGYPEQDAEIGRDRTNNDDSDGHAGFSFTKLDPNGNALPITAVVWSCVRDNVTGRVWEEKTRSGTSGLRSIDNSYTWYNPDFFTNGGDAGVQNGGRCVGSNCDTRGYVQTINATGLCGFRDWRLPNVDELLSIVTNDRSGPTVDTRYFGLPVDTEFWTASLRAEDPRRAMTVDFRYGWFGSQSKGSGDKVRLVRGGR